MSDSASKPAVDTATGSSRYCNEIAYCSPLDSFPKDAPFLGRHGELSRAETTTEGSVPAYGWSERI